MKKCQLVVSKVFTKRVFERTMAGFTTIPNKIPVKIRS